MGAHGGEIVAPRQNAKHKSDAVSTNSIEVSERLLDMARSLAAISGTAAEQNLQLNEWNELYYSMCARFSNLEKLCDQQERRIEKLEHASVVSAAPPDAPEHALCKEAASNEPIIEPEYEDSKIVDCRKINQREQSLVRFSNCPPNEPMVNKQPIASILEPVDNLDESYGLPNISNSSFYAGETENAVTSRLLQEMYGFISNEI